MKVDWKLWLVAFGITMIPVVTTLVSGFLLTNGFHNEVTSLKSELPEKPQCTMLHQAHDDRWTEYDCGSYMRICDNSAGYTGCITINTTTSYYDSLNPGIENKTDGKTCYFNYGHSVPDYGKIDCPKGFDADG